MGMILYDREGNAHDIPHMIDVIDAEKVGWTRYNPVKRKKIAKVVEPKPVEHSEPVEVPEVAEATEYSEPIKEGEEKVDTGYSEAIKEGEEKVDTDYSEAIKEGKSVKKKDWRDSIKEKK